MIKELKILKEEKDKKMETINIIDKHGWITKVQYIKSLDYLTITQHDKKYNIRKEIFIDRDIFDKFKNFITNIRR